MAESKLLPELFAGLLSAAIGRFLSLDPQSTRWLEPLAGRTICFRLQPFGLDICLCPSAESIEVLPSCDDEPDVRFTGSPLAFARMGLGGEPRSLLFAGEVTVEGDMKVAQRFQRLFEKLDIDWESLLARYTGKTLATHIIGGLRESHAWRVETVDAFSLNLVEYLQEESRELPVPVEAELFFADVDELRADCDRLEAKILRLEQTLGEPSTVHTSS